MFSPLWWYARETEALDFEQPAVPPDCTLYKIQYRADISNSISFGPETSRAPKQATKEELTG